MQTQIEGGTLKTRWTLVRRLKDLGDGSSWEEFAALYRPLIMGIGVKAGLREPEAKDAAQETMASVSKHIGEFVADPARGSFRAWLLTMARWRVQDQFRKRLPVAENGAGAEAGTARTATLERFPDAQPVDLAALCDAEWREWVLERAMEELPMEVKADHFQIFYLLTAEGRSMAEVGKIVGRSAAQIYVIKHRVALALKRIAKRIQREQDKITR